MEARNPILRADGRIPHTLECNYTSGESPVSLLEMIDRNRKTQHLKYPVVEKKRQFQNFC